MKYTHEIVHQVGFPLHKDKACTAFFSLHFLSETFFGSDKYVYLTSDTQDTHESAGRSSCKVPLLLHFNRD